MNKKTTSPTYLGVAKDLALRISEGELKEGQKILGRSTLAGSYNVSSETIRRALHVLMDMKVVEIKPQSGIYIRSIENARQYLKMNTNENELKEKLDQLDDLKTNANTVIHDLLKTVDEIVNIRYSHQTSDDYFPTYRIRIPETSHLCGKMLGETRFWQHTGATVIAMQRKNKMILSPGPYAYLYGEDTLILVGTLDSIDKAKKLVAKEREETTDDSI